MGHCNLLTSFQILPNVAKDGTLARLEYEFEQCTHDITSNVGKPLFANVCYVECRRQYRAAVQWLFVGVAAVPQCHACMHDCMARMSLLATERSPCNECPWRRRTTERDEMHFCKRHRHQRCAESLDQRESITPPRPQVEQ